MASSSNNAGSQSPSRKEGLSGLWSRFANSNAATRPRSSTTSSVHASDPSTSPSRRPDNARERLQSILDSQKHQHKAAHKSATPRSVSGPAASSPSSATDLGDAYGPYTANEPSVYLDLLKPTAQPLAQATKCQYIHCLADSIRVYADVDPVSTWLQATHLLARAEALDVRLAALELLRTCIAAREPSVAERQAFYASVVDYDVDVEQCADDEIGGLHRACEALCRGGRDVAGLEDLVELLCDYAGEMFKRRQAVRDSMRLDFFKRHPEQSRAPAAQQLAYRRVSPLQDPTFIACFVAYPPPPADVMQDAAMGPIALLTNIHKFSWPHLSPDDVRFATSYLVLEALATSHDTVVGLVLDHVDVMSRFGYVPPDQIDAVLCFLARVVAQEARGRTLTYVGPDGQPAEPHVQPFSTRLCDKARLVVKNLLRSSANQALRCLQAGTAPPAEGDELRDVQVAVGSLKCLRDVLNEIRAAPGGPTPDAPALSSTFLDSWPILLAMGLPVLFPNLCDALLWPQPEVAEQVLLLLYDRLTRSTAGLAQANGAALTKTTELDLVEGPGQLSYDEWDLILDLLERTLPHVRRFEDDAQTIWVLDLTAALSNDDLSDEVAKEGMPAILAVYRRILVFTLTVYYAGSYKGPLDRLFALLFALEPNLSDSSAVMLLDGYEKENISLPTNADWLEDFGELISAFLILQPASQGLNDSVELVFRHRSTRVAAVYRSLVLVADTYEAVRDFAHFREPLIRRIIVPVIEYLLDANALQKPLAPALAKLIRDVAQDAFLSSPADAERPVYEMLRTALLAQIEPPTLQGRSSQKGEPSKAARQATAGLFAACSLFDLFHCAAAAPSHTSSLVANAIYRDLLQLLSSSATLRQVRFVVLQFLVRFRATPANKVFLTRDVDVAGLASLLNRFKHAEAAADDGKSAPVAVDGAGEQERGRARKAAESPTRRSTNSRSVSRFGREPSKERAAPPEHIPVLWSMSEKVPFEVPEMTPLESRFGLISFDYTLEWQESSEGDPNSFPEYDQGMANRSLEVPVVLPVSEYFRTLLKLIEEDTDWDLVAYILCVFPEQLSCKHFACGPRASKEVHRLRAHLCENLTKGGLAKNTILPPGARRADLPQIAYQTLTTLIAYKTLFTKKDQDDMVETFITGLTQRDIAKPCIHALAMCCHELQPSMTKHLSRVLVSLLKILSSSQMAVHILELIASVGQIPTLFSSFTDDDYRTVFGIALQYIGLHNDALSTEASNGASANRKDDLAYAFSQYVFHLAYYVIDLWYMSLRLSNRRKHVSFIVKKLIQANESRGELDEPSEVCIDMIARYAYSDVDPLPSKSSLQELIERTAAASGKPVDKAGEQRTWVRGHALITIKSFGLGGWAEVTVRRPSGTVRMLFEVEDPVRSTDDNARDRITARAAQDQARQPEQDRLEALKQEQAVLSAADLAAQYGIQIPAGIDGTIDLAQSKALLPENPTGPAISPAFYILQTSGFPEFHTEPPLLVPEDERFQRSVKLLDNVPVVDFHKVAILYVAAEDYTEQDILSNTHGSRDYVHFLSGLGKLVRLKGNMRFYLGGLDKEADLDGKWAYIWGSNVSQIVYHVATLMPTDLERDPQCTGKKRHIGNDFVKVIFNDSGRPFSADTIPGQFNFVTIVIEPQTPVGKSWMAHGMSSNTMFFKVSMQRRADMPEIGPLGVFKMVSATCLPVFVRHLALHANVFAQVFLESVGIEGRQEGQRQKTEFVSNWRRRLQQIKQLKSRLRPAGAGGPPKAQQVKDLEGALSTVDFSTWT